MDTAEDMVLKKSNSSSSCIGPPQKSETMILAPSASSSAGLDAWNAEYRADVGLAERFSGLDLQRGQLSRSILESDCVGDALFATFDEGSSYVLQEVPNVTKAMVSEYRATPRCTACLALSAVHTEKCGARFEEKCG